MASVSLRRLLNITYAYLVRDVEPKEIDNFDAKMNGTYVPQPGDPIPERTGPFVVSRNEMADLDALDSLARDQNPPTM